MPELCRFFGIIITMFYDDHAPPHFHVRYGEHKAIMTIDSLMLLDGLCRHGYWGWSPSGAHCIRTS